mmetsp:Transcript_21198/g.45925  ORF Transcript_21198/g.45925 Transcript_21198/m.45925 type:complete len:281 (-) Transcript_21198:1524-2366(-)
MHLLLRTRESPSMQSVLLMPYYNFEDVRYCTTSLFTILYRPTSLQPISLNLYNTYSLSLFISSPSEITSYTRLIFFFPDPPFGNTLYALPEGNFLPALLSAIVTSSSVTMDKLMLIDKTTESTSISSSAASSSSSAASVVSDEAVVSADTVVSERGASVVDDTNVVSTSTGVTVVVIETSSGRDILIDITIKSKSMSSSSGSSFAALLDTSASVVAAETVLVSDINAASVLAGTAVVAVAVSSSSTTGTDITISGILMENESSSTSITGSSLPALESSFN